MNKRQRAAREELGETIRTAAEQRALGRSSVELRQHDGRFKTLGWYDDEAFCIEQARYLSRNFKDEARVRDHNDRITFTITACGVEHVARHRRLP